MYTARVVNQQGNALRLTGNEAAWQVVRITGLNSPTANVNMTKIAGMDGAVFSSAFVNTRNIVITLRINGDADANRQQLNKIFRIKQELTLYFETSGRKVMATGIIDSIECDLFTSSELYQVSIICPYPYLQAQSYNVYELQNSAAGFYFPFAIDQDDPIPFSEYVKGRVTEIDNETGVATGFLLTVKFNTNKASMFKLQNVDTGESIQVNYPFLEGDVLHFNTNENAVNFWLTRDGRDWNMMSKLSSGYSIMQINPGVNHFAYMTESHFYDEFLNIRLLYRPAYQGV